MIHYRYRDARLKNGLRIIASENFNSPIATIGVWLRAGSRYEGKGEEGYPHLLEHLMLDGTERRPTRFAVAKEADRLGAYLNASTGRERVSFVVQVAYEYAAEMFELLADIVMKPLLSADALEIEKKVVMEELNRVKENPQRFLVTEGLMSFFHGHPLSRDPLGTIESVNRATSERLVQYHRKFYAPERCGIIALGRVSFKKAIRLAEQHFGTWGNVSTAVENVGVFSPRSRYFFQKSATDRTYLMLNFAVPPAVDVKAHAALHCIANYLGYGQSSLLKQELRAKRGLIYDLQAASTPFLDAGRFFIETASQNPSEVLAVILEYIARLKNFFTPQLVETIKLQTMLSFQRKMADQFEEHEFLGHRFLLLDRLFSPAEYVSVLRDLTHEDLCQATARYLSPATSFLAVSGPEDRKVKAVYDDYLKMPG